MRFSLNLRYIFSIYCCCQILENIKIIGPYKEEIWTPKHWTCNITTGRQLCPKTFGGRCMCTIINNAITQSSQRSNVYICLLTRSIAKITKFIYFSDQLLRYSFIIPVYAWHIIWKCKSKYNLGIYYHFIFQMYNGYTGVMTWNNSQVFFLQINASRNIISECWRRPNESRTSKKAQSHPKLYFVLS